MAIFRSFIQDPTFDPNLFKEIADTGVGFETYMFITSTERLKTDNEISKVAEKIFQSCIPPSLDDTTKTHYTSALRRHHTKATKMILSMVSNPELYSVGWDVCGSNVSRIGPEELDVLEYLADHPAGIEALKHGTVEWGNQDGTWSSEMTRECVQHSAIREASYKYNRPQFYEKIAPILNQYTHDTRPPNNCCIIS